MPDIIHCENFLNEVESEKLYDFLLNHCNFNQKTVNFSGIENKIPRLIEWYGPYSYFYSGISNPARQLPLEIQLIADKISAFLESMNVHAKFNSVLINYYRNGNDKIGMHSDDETQLGENSIIASLSLGDSRVFKMRNKITKEIKNYVLKNGAVFIMKGQTQKLWTHGINAEANKQSRINLTFRDVKYPPHNE